jgi:hypothetical protein
LITAFFVECGECQKVNGREPKSCLGQVFNFKLGCFCHEYNCVAQTNKPQLELKTRPLFCPLNLISYYDIILLCSRIHLKWISCCYCAKTWRQNYLELISLWRQLLPLYFLIQFFDPDQPYICTIYARHFDMNKLLRNLTSFRQLVLLLYLVFPSSLLSDIQISKKSSQQRLIYIYGVYRWKCLQNIPKMPAKSPKNACKISQKCLQKFP